MFRPTFALFKKAIQASPKEIIIYRGFASGSRFPKSTAKITLVAASLGAVFGAGYGGYTHFKVNSKKRNSVIEPEAYTFLANAPDYKPQYRVVNDNDTSNLKLVLFQYRTCPFCCKVRAFLDYQGISYDIVEVDAVLRQAIKWSGYKKVPILLAEVEGGYQQLMDSSAIISVLETYLLDKGSQLRDLLKFYPANKYFNDDGKEVTDITNKYFIMKNTPNLSDKEKKLEMEVREWRQWSDRVLVHMLSPNVYRTPSEALQAFRWFEEVGGWKNTFPAWECALMVYGGAMAMWLISKRLKTRHNLSDDVRSSLYDTTNQWVKAVQAKGTTFLGGDQPNLADISVYGVLSSIEGCDAFQELRQHTDVAKWFDATKDYIEGTRGKVLLVNA